nr:MAG TPA: portal [Caudoviricetes sp.]
MKFWEKIKTLVWSKTEPTQTDEAMVTANGRVLSDHPSNRITPSKLKSILEDAENGDITAQHELFMDIEEQDSAIGANIQTRKRAILTLDWRIAEPRNATPAEEKLQTEIDELFYQYPNLENLLMDMMDAVGHGFSALEIEWKLENGKYIPHNFIARPQSWFKLDKNDNLLLKTPSNAIGEPLRPFGWVVHSHKSRSVQLARMGLFRTLAWLYMFKHYSVRDFAEFLELYGMPIRIGKYGAGATNEEKRTLLRALAQIGHNAAGIMPDSMTIELHNAANTGAGSGNNPFLQMVDWCEKSIARLILGQTLTSGADGKSSTNALGNVHNEVRRDLLVSDAKQVAQTITQQIILPYLQINVDPNIALHRVPYFEFDTKKYDDLSTFADAIPKLVGIGVQIPEKWTRDKLGIPEAQDGEVVLKAVQSDFNPDLKTPRKSTALSAHVVGCQCDGCLGKGTHVALSAGNKSETEQDLLDSLLDNSMTQVDFNQQLDPMVQKAVAVLSACNSYEEAGNKLAELYPDLTSEAHERYLTSALFLADLLGASNAERT